MTQFEFIGAYRSELVARYPWAKDEGKLARFMISVQRTMEGPEKTWNHDGEAVTAAWRALGGKGKPTLKALRAIPRA